MIIYMKNIGNLPSKIFKKYYKKYLDRFPFAIFITDYNLQIKKYTKNQLKSFDFFNIYNQIDLMVIFHEISKELHELPEWEILNEKQIKKEIIEYGNN